MSSIEVKIKNDNSPVTKADLNSERVIVSMLKNHFKYPILTEETPIAYQETKLWEKYWLVDPLDGTKDFIDKNGEFTINIALIVNSRPILGVVYAPALNLMYSAQEGKGSYKNNIKIFNSSKRKKLIGADSRYHSTDETINFFNKFDINKIKRVGSALKLCYLAEGKIDVYPRFNGTKEWDTAASHIICIEAGCKLIDVETKNELLYHKESIINNSFVASRNDLNFYDFL
ncbi:MAG: 3'(2'),5'-bisphosphate nucleotidase CysQ [Rhodobiaceae bacterium]|nr:3'(2'),5'-bisphosphate nucleotidase CysQ [Rhodobiaceae bacterium]